MKRIISVIVAAVLMMAVLTACGGAKAADLNAIMSDINTQFGYTDLKTLEDTDALNRYYQISADGVKQFAAELSTTASQYTEVVLVEATDSTAADSIKTQLAAHLGTQLNTAKSYDAEQVAMIEACSVQQNGNYVWLVVSDKYSEITAIIDAALK